MEARACDGHGRVEVEDRWGGGGCGRGRWLRMVAGGAGEKVRRAGREVNSRQAGRTSGC